MKTIMKKTLCILSSAVLLCGLTALPAGAKSLDPENIVKLEPGIKPPTFQIVEPYKNTEFVLKDNSFSIRPGGSAVLEVGKKYKLIDEDYSWPRPEKRIQSLDDVDLLRLRFQWYDENGPIEGATSYRYTAHSAGKYFCVVTMIIRHLWVTNTATVNIDFRLPPRDPGFVPRPYPSIPSKPGPLPI